MTEPTLTISEGLDEHSDSRSLFGLMDSRGSLWRVQDGAADGRQTARSNCHSRSQEEGSGSPETQQFAPSTRDDQPDPRPGGTHRSGSTVASSRVCLGVDVEMSEKVLDLFAGPGGTARGFQREGFEVIGVDSNPSPKYPSRCVTHDLRDGLPDEVRGERYRYVWASPPCTKFTSLGGDGDNLIPLARELVSQVDADATIIENVPEARDNLKRPVVLSGATEHELIDIEVRKKRLFEVSWFGTSPPRERDATFRFAIGERESPADEYREAHGLGNSDLHTKELHDAIPPAYVRFLVWQHRQTESTRVEIER